MTNLIVAIRSFVNAPKNDVRRGRALYPSKEQKETSRNFFMRKRNNLITSVIMYFKKGRTCSFETERKARDVQRAVTSYDNPSLENKS